METHVKAVLGTWLPRELANDIVNSFLHIRSDLATRTLERSAPGKFVETFVQVLQFLDQGRYDERPNVDEYLRKVQDGASELDDGLRICGARIARAMYALRSKRNIVHKGKVDPNTHDLAMLHGSAQWIIAELVRNASGISMEKAGYMVGQIQAPVPVVVEDFGKFKVVLHDLSAEHEILVLIRDDYPGTVPRTVLTASMRGRHDSTIRKALPELVRKRLIVGNPRSGYRLTHMGLSLAEEIVAEVLAAKGIAA